MAVIDDKKVQCNLCKALNDSYLIIKENKLAIAFLPISPLKEGHVMVLPKRHIKFEELTSEESKAVSELLIYLKNKLLKLFPEDHPLFVTLMDTKHSSIREHFHYHVIPSKDNLRKIISEYYKVEENKKYDKKYLEKMAKKLRS